MSWALHDPLEPPRTSPENGPAPEPLGTLPVDTRRLQCGYTWLQTLGGRESSSQYRCHSHATCIQGSLQSRGCRKQVDFLNPNQALHDGGGCSECPRHGLSSAHLSWAARLHSGGCSGTSLRPSVGTPAQPARDQGGFSPRPRSGTGARERPAHRAAGTGFTRQPRSPAPPLPGQDPPRRRPRLGVALPREAPPTTRPHPPESKAKARSASRRSAARVWRRRRGAGSARAASPAGGMEGPRAAAASGDVSLHNFSARLWEQLVHFHVMRLTDSLFLWVGATPHLRNLAVAMCTRYDPIPVSTALLGDTSDTTSTGLAQRLARKTNKQVFVSYNLQNTDSSFAFLVENRIKEEMEAFPEKF
ncbi:proteasome assembly chaperone 4 isoform X3 [Vicugna pacos]|uniref:Proteasome assembly chaperone 4 isoform X3 n=1 Tax=Vicugna pacos TaxID=30538 RepID=A0ABM5BZQ0_VICPA